MNISELRMTDDEAFSNGQWSRDLQIWLQGHNQIFSPDTCQSKEITKWAHNSRLSWLKLIYFQESLKISVSILGKS